MNEDSPSGMSLATIANSAKTHKIKFVDGGYSALQCSARCFPETKHLLFYQKPSTSWKSLAKQWESMHWKQLPRGSWLELHKKDWPVTTPKFEAKDCTTAPAMVAIRSTQRSCNTNLN